MRFKEFLINEQQAYLASKVGSLLTAIQELVTDMQNLGTRELVQFSGNVVNRIRRILHSNWPKEEKKFLVVLQKVAVAISKSIEEKDDLPGTLQAAAGELEKLVADMGVPINQLVSTEGMPKDEKESGTEQPAQAASQAPQMPQEIENIPQAVSPTQTGQDAYTAPLGGSAGPLGGF
jgi:hypothetical protein